MFHPDLYKISLCTKFMNSHSCDRGKYCAFAHSNDELRVTSKYSHHINFDSSADGEANDGSPKHYALLETEVIEKLIKLIKKHGADGIISSELPRRYFDMFGERLELTHESGEKLRIKEILSHQPCISVFMHKGVQPKYVYIDNDNSTLDSPDRIGYTFEYLYIFSFNDFM